VKFCTLATTLRWSSVVEALDRHDIPDGLPFIVDGDGSLSGCDQLNICSTNAVESLNARYRRAIRARGHFPTEQAGMKCPYLVTRSLDPTGRGKARWAMGWKPALNAFAITFEGRITPTGNKPNAKVGSTVNRTAPSAEIDLVTRKRRGRRRE
jgi:hypothetical protein